MEKIRPRRDIYTVYDNKHPITDLNEALYLLDMKPTSNEPLQLSKREDEENKIWEVIAPWYHEAGNGVVASDYHYYQIDQALVERLVDERLVAPYTKKVHAFVHEEPEKLVITQEGKRRARNFENEQLDAAVELLIRGVHTDTEGHANRVSWGREHWRYGRFCVDYDTPDSKRCRVYPESEKVVMMKKDPNTDEWVVETEHTHESGELEITAEH